jgi:hypothetical protein
MRYKMEDDTVVDTDKATATYEEKTDWDGRNQISRATGSQFDHQTLYRSAKARYYVVHTSQWEGKLPSAEWISPEQAAAWLVLMGAEVPPELEEAAGKVTE